MPRPPRFYLPLATDLLNCEFVHCLGSYHAVVIRLECAQKSICAIHTDINSFLLHLLRLLCVKQRQMRVHVDRGAKNSVHTISTDLIWASVAEDGQPWLYAFRCACGGVIYLPASPFSLVKPSFSRQAQVVLDTKGKH